MPDIERFSAGCRYPLRPYQLESARAIVDSVSRADGKIITRTLLERLDQQGPRSGIEFRGTPSA